MTMTKTTAKKLAAAAAMCLTVGVVLAAGTGKFAKKPRIQGVQIGQAYAAVNGTRSFTEAVAVVQNDVLVGAYLDDFQFNDAKPEVVGVPNSDAAFGADYAEGQVLMSKRENTGFYSQLMTDYAGSTVSIDANFDAIQEFAVGKTIAELKAVAAKGAEAVDAVSGATLADTAGYLSALVQAAEAAQSNAVAPFEGDVRQLELKVVYSAANGDNCFTSGAAVTCGDTIVASYVDEFQFMDASPEIIGVPNSDADLSAGYASGKVLASKRVNTKTYSQMMADYAGSTVTIDANYNSIQEHLAGMSIAAAAALSQDTAAVDAVSGATLVNTANYVGVIVDAAQKLMFRHFAASGAFTARRRLFSAKSAKNPVLRAYPYANRVQSGILKITMPVCGKNGGRKPWTIACTKHISRS